MWWLVPTYAGPVQRKTLKGSKHPEMEKNVYKWFLNLRSKKILVSDHGD